MFIFLDIDGVLNDKKTRNGPRLDKKSLYWQKEDISLEKIDILNEIIEKTGSEVILHSSWCKHWSKSYLTDFFNHLGLCKPIYDFTNGVFRVLEIKKLIREHKMSNFVVLDDFCLKDNFGSSHFMTDYDEGLKRDHVDLIIQILQTSVDYKTFEVKENEKIELDGGDENCLHSFYSSDTGKLTCRFCEGEY